MTETISHGIIGDVHQENVPLSIGRAAPEYEIRVVRPDGSSTIPDEPGELLIRGVRGVSLFKEYLNDPTATSQSFDSQGFFSTGDRVTVLPDGAILFSDRSKDLLKVGGENVSASEIEKVAACVPGVREAAVVGKYDPMLDEVPVLFVVPQGGATQANPSLVEEIMKHCKDKLADFKVPREIRILDKFPRSTLEKVSKLELLKLL